MKNGLFHLNKNCRTLHYYLKIEHIVRKCTKIKQNPTKNQLR